jgi:hypothetical protein
MVRIATFLLSILNNVQYPEFHKKLYLISRSGINTSEVFLVHRQYCASARIFARLLTFFLERESLIRRGRIPPKRFIGIGYRDKGSIRNLAYDGSPPWQEVASSLNYSGYSGRMKTIWQSSNEWIVGFYRKLLEKYQI